MQQMETLGKRPIGEMLVDAGLIQRQQLNEALKAQAAQGGKLVQILISLGYFEPKSFVNFLARQPGVASIDLSHYEVPRELVALVPKEFALKHEVFPIDRLGKLLTVGMVCPLDAQTIGELERNTGLRVKPILCSPEDVRKAIHRYYPADIPATLEVADGPEAPATPHALRKLETSLRLGNVISLVRRIEGLPTLPETVQKVRQVMMDPNSSIGDVAEIITTDPPIAARVLRVANSAAYGFPHRIDNIRLAVSLLGLRETYSLVLTAAIIDRYSESRRFNYGAFWEHSLACATACKIVAQACGQSQRTSVSSAGLLHDIGRIALVEVAAELYSKVSPELHGDDLVAEEERILGISHAEAGFELASHWGLPVDISQAVRFHHSPQYAVEAREVVAIVGVADRLCRMAEEEDEAGLRSMELLENQLHIIGLVADDAPALVRQYREVRASDLRQGRGL
jgi:putative nucleotidyltransferase with HDIG domain